MSGTVGKGCKGPLLQKDSLQQASLMNELKVEREPFSQITRL